ncbi:MFS general substrate transporter [Rhizoclosmatium globosum]|uniref:MFS general substrate transporter n=1 Tax=Rhizoclosmatium globosum TaxID=329046 RepID=A0A1Y2C8Q9_9FUNG|nr:MFS general substrate transporter [Rhizoclosmatium globosum]|eukprot:ORY43408.1 MFS general substrate transporter [Rhizoclosmatium globosum]
MAVCGLQPHPYHALIAFFLKVFAITVGYMPMQQMILIIVCSDVMPEVSVSSVRMPDYAICAANATVSATAASWSLSQQLFESVPSLFVICIAGYFLDKYGRTSAMILSALSVLFTAVTTLTVAVIVEHEIEGYSASALLYALLTAAGFSGIAGGLVLFRTACSAYLSDTTLPATRTRYFLLLDAAMSVAITGGPLIGGSLANTLGFTYTFGVTLGISLLLLVHLLFIFPSSQTHSEPSNQTNETKSAVQAFMDSIKATVDTLKSICKFKTALALITILTIIGFLLAGAQVFFLFYTGKLFGWTSLDFGKFALFAASQKILWLSVLLPSFLAFIQSRGGDKIIWEIRILRVGIFVATVGELCYAFAPTSNLFMLCSLFASFSCFAGPTIRSLLSTLVPPSHQGRLFASIQIFESAAAIVATAALNLIFQKTVNFMPNAVFLSMSALLVVAFVLSLWAVGKEGVLGMEGGGVSHTEVEVVATEETPLLGQDV